MATSHFSVFEVELVFWFCKPTAQQPNSCWAGLLMAKHNTAVATSIRIGGLACPAVPMLCDCACVCLCVPVYCACVCLAVCTGGIRNPFTHGHHDSAPPTPTKDKDASPTPKPYSPAVRLALSPASHE